MRIVIDTSVLVSGLIRPQGIPGDVLRFLRNGKFTALYSNEIRLVLARNLYIFKLNAQEKTEPWTFSKEIDGISIYHRILEDSALKELKLSTISKATLTATVSTITNIDSLPKLKPWEGDFELQTYQNPKAYREESLINEAIENVIGHEKDVKRIKDIKNKILEIKSYFRDLSS